MQDLSMLTPPPHVIFSSLVTSSSCLSAVVAFTTCPRRVQVSHDVATTFSSHENLVGHHFSFPPTKTQLTTFVLPFYCRKQHFNNTRCQQPQRNKNSSKRRILLSLPPVHQSTPQKRRRIPTKPWRMFCWKNVLMRKFGPSFKICCRFVPISPRHFG